MFYSRLAQAIIFTSLVVYRGYRKKSLSLSGGIAASIVGFIIGLTGIKFSLILAVFFFSSSYLTKYKADVKKHIEDDFREGGQRNWVQVVSNGLSGTVACGIILYWFGFVDIYFDFKSHKWESILLAAYIGHFACCNGDTWASELGVLSKTKPISIITFKEVPPGTNGGISLLGCLVSLVGGLVIGVTYYISNVIFSNPSSQPPQYPAILLGALSGFLGSLLDSLLGATLQYSGWSADKRKVVAEPGPRVSRISGLSILDNHQVNLISSTLTAIAAGLAAGALFPVA